MLQVMVNTGFKRKKKSYSLNPILTITQRNILEKYFKFLKITLFS